MFVVVIGTLLTLQLLGVFASPSSTHTGNGTQQATAGAGTTSTPDATTPTPSPSGGSVTPQQAVTVLTHYYSNINAKDYRAAYNLWGSSYQSSTPYTTFANGFANTQKDVVQFGEAVALPDGTAKVSVTVIATVWDGGSTTVNTYQGYYIVGRENGSAKLLNANLQLVRSSNERVKQAVATLNQYYADINAKDYQGAYNLWGTAYRNSTSYQQFASGFARTQSVSITIQYESITVLNEGSVKVPLTIRSIEKTQSGTVTHTYQGYYILGTEGNSWQLFSASIQ